MFCIHCGKADVPDDAVVCVGCGRAVAPKVTPVTSSNKVSSSDSVHWGFMLLGFFIPLAGFILGIIFIAQRKQGAVILLILSIVMFLISYMILTSALSSSSVYSYR